jgi:hypothetical protein
VNTISGILLESRSFQDRQNKSLSDGALGRHWLWREIFCSSQYVDVATRDRCGPVVKACCRLKRCVILGNVALPPLFVFAKNRERPFGALFRTSRKGLHTRHHESTRDLEVPLVMRSHVARRRAPVTSAKRLR